MGKLKTIDIAGLEDISAIMDKCHIVFKNTMANKENNAIQLSIISVVFCHREPLFFMPKNFKNITKNS